MENIIRKVASKTNLDSGREYRINITCKTLMIFYVHMPLFTKEELTALKEQIGCSSKSTLKKAIYIITEFD